VDLETEKLVKIVAQAMRGDEMAKETLYRDAHRSVYYLALRLVKNPEDAEDITQEVLSR
jgi:DNA-directed RNA polymerase specialized sigma24 family protein